MNHELKPKSSLTTRPPTNIFSFENEFVETDNVWKNPVLIFVTKPFSGVQNSMSWMVMREASQEFGRR